MPSLVCMETSDRTPETIVGNKNDLYAGIVWIISGVVLSVYGVVSAFNTHIPGIENVINFLLDIETHYIYVGAFFAVLIEGLYIVGSFFPGASLIVIFAILAQTSGFFVFVTTITLVFVGWCVAGLLNIYGARIYLLKVLKQKKEATCLVDDRLLLTWFPAFRASHEVAQIIEGAPLSKVLVSSLRVRVFGVLLVVLLSLIVPVFLDLEEISRDESLFVLLIVIVVCFFVGVSKVRGYMLSCRRTC